jgi:hypothetical protein
MFKSISADLLQLALTLSPEPTARSHEEIALSVSV